MKAIVISNCGTASYVAGLKLLFPDWEVRGVVVQNAQLWTGAEPKPEFLDYVSQCELFLGLNLAEYNVNLTLPERADRVLIPAFVFRGLHPDATNFTGCRSVLGHGTLFSRLMLAAYAVGATVGQAKQLFNEQTYEALGYLAAFGRERTALIDRFRAQDIFIADLIDGWTASGAFLYIPEHAKPLVYFDILRRALLSRYLTAEQAAAAAPQAALVPDYFAEGPIWAVYPEIGQRQGIVGDLVWRRGRAGAYESVGRDAFVEQSYACLAAAGALSAKSMPNMPFFTDTIRALLAGGRNAGRAAQPADAVSVADAE